MRSQQIYFTADTHFGHTNILRYCDRPFTSIEEHDRVLINNINAVVAPGDILYHLGDFAFRGAPISHYRNQIDCRTIILIVGNHDPTYADGTGKKELRSIFSRVYDQMRVRISIDEQNQTIVLNHYAMRVWRNSHHGAWHLYGHSHGKLLDDPHAQSFDIGVDCHDYKPLNLEQITTIMDKKLAEMPHFPQGWDKNRVEAVLQHYESQTEDEAVAEQEEAFRMEKKE